MNALAVILLAAPPMWMALIWCMNRFAVHNLLRPGIRAVFAVSAISPMAAILLWVFAQGSPLAAMRDPKVLLILIEIGLPASLLVSVIAYWGCRGRLAEQ